MGAGKVGVGDATAGSVRHTGEQMDDAKCLGRHSLEIDFERLPKNASDLFFVLSSPTRHDISQYSDVYILLRDAENPGHEIAVSRVEASQINEALVLSCASRQDDGNWRLETFGCTSQGNARDYRPMLLCVRAIQEKKYTLTPQWPHRIYESPDN